MSSPVDRWDVMTLQLTGEPLPALPDLPGRLHVQPAVTERDPMAEAWDAAERTIKRTTAESTTI